MTEITQADRDAAASGYFAWCSGNPVIPDRMKAGDADDHSMVQAFARHRMEATEALRAENERLLDIDEVKANVIDSLLNDLASAEQENERLREALMLCAKHVDWMPHPHCVEVETAIRAALGDTK